MSQKQLIFSNTTWEKKYAYARAVKIGNLVEVAGTTAVNDEGQIVGENDPYAQSIFIFQKIEKALREAGASLKDVIRTRVYITQAAFEEAAGKAHGETFADIFPASSMLVIQALINPKLLVEIEATAVITQA
ncbi:MAG TPA: hypothetical protein DCM08_05325 [Microscillaceae bacterium]|jgi:enamine deaminase RidA (YjgF/YER057c/UK114 family)|nr:hypothetical protein [Microscillaceae bacterium]